ncbi:RNA polymerase sigma factor [candidate division KSB1 bacterium]
MMNGRNKSFNEKELVNRSQNGDTTAFAMLVKEYSSGILTFINRMILSREDAEDISQVVFIKAYKGLSLFKGNSSFKTWLYTIAKNESYSFMKKKNPQKVSLDEKADLMDSISIQYPETDAENALVKEEFIKTVRKGLEQLPLKYNTIIQLFYLKEFKYEEIAEILKIPMGTVKTHLFRAVKMLRKEVLHNLEEKVYNEM